MLIDYDVLKKLGTTNDAIKALFTATAGSELHEKRKAWESRIEGRIQEGALWGLKNHQFYTAADLAWDANIITKELVPLSLYAQGKITFKELESDLKTLSPELQAQFVKKNEAGQTIGIDLPAFHKVVVNLVRSLITKRVASLSTRYVKQDPLMEYVPLGTSYVSKLRADVLGQRIEMMANQYGYRHDLVQAIRDMLLYSWVFEFPRNRWDRERTIRKKKTAAGFDTSKDVNFDMETVVSREGLLYKRPHPSRSFYDMAYPASSINTDTGCTYVGHWNLIPYREVCDNNHFFNRNQVEFDTAFASKLVGYRNYWSLYFPGQPINFPGQPGQQVDVAGANNREQQSGYYSTEDKDRTVLLTEYFEKVIPKDVGIGEYPFPVWVRLVVVSDHTVVYGEIMPCTPATYWGYNCADGKILNNAFAHEAMPFQDQMSNMFTNLLFAQKSALVKILSLDIDQIQDPKLLAEVRKTISGESIYTRPVLIEHKGTQSSEMGLDPRRVVQISETQALADPTLYFRSILQVMTLAERVLGTSANESSQSEPREVSATESSNIAVSVNTNTAFMGLGVDEGLAAKKRQLYEAFMACGETRVVVPVANRYTQRTIKAAGFEPFTQEEEGSGLNENMAGDEPKRLTVMGEKVALEFAYSFSSRDGSERPSNVKAAEVLVQLLQPLSQMPGLLEALGKEGLYDYLNAVIRMSGAGIDVNFEVKDGETDAMPTGDAVTDNKQELNDVIGRLLGAIEQDRAAIARIEQALGLKAQGMPSGIPPAQTPSAGTAGVPMQ